MHADVVVVGAGLTGATVARRLADQGLSVLVLERRAQVGGNCADIRHEPSGLLVNKHGPHYFRTGSKRIWEFVCQYAAFVPFAARVRAHADGELHRWPIALQQVVRSQHHPSDSHATNFEDVCIARFGQKHYDMLIGPYTKKQWGVEPSTLSADLARRIELRLGDDDRLMTVPYQGVPLMGYSAMVRSMLFGVDTLTGVDWLKTEVSAPVVVYTGAIDEFFDYAFGRLRYRSQRRVDVYHSQKPMHQGFVQINYPSPDVDYVRAIEWRHMRKEKHATGTVVTYEYPQDAK
jgi:UDP-galactopyranose mutase